MQCPTCRDQSLHASMTQQGVEVDYCRQCQGVWLDKGEIFYFTKRPKELAEAFLHAQTITPASPRLSPKTGKPMQEMRFLDGRLVIDVCPDTEGMWCDDGEIERLVNTDPKLLSLRLDTTLRPLDEKPAASRDAQSRATRLRLPNLGIRAVITIFFMYAPLTALLGVLVEYAYVPAAAALIFGVALIGLHWGLSPWILDRLLCRVLPIRWIPIAELPEPLRAFIRHVCETHGIVVPDIGILADSRPNALTYGGPSKRVRMILTQGVLDRLNDEEQTVVAARELGHAARWDIRVMTVACTVPWILSLPAYRLLHDIKNAQGSAVFSSLLAIVVYWLHRVASWPMRGLSRARHIAADRFACDVTGQPNRVLLTFVRIMNDLAGPGFQKEANLSGKPLRCPLFDSIGALGIMDLDMAKTFVVSARNAEKPLKHSDRNAGLNILGALKWELWNPWARYYEWHALHPLFTRRIRYLMNQAETLEREPIFRVSEQKPERYWNEFVVDLMVLSAPPLALLAFAVIAALTQQQALLGLGLVVTGILALVKFFFTYPSELFPLMTISSLFKHIKVSGIRPVSCSLKGQIFSDPISRSACIDSIVMRDYTGITVLEYLQPLRVWEFLFSALRAPAVAANDIYIEGWYRRSPVPYIEIKTVSTPAGTQTCYASTIRKIMILLMILLGFILAFVPLDTLIARIP